MINFEIPTSSVGRLSKAFNLMESHKLELGVVDYALSQSTLEQVRVSLKLAANPG
jgi:hypothetical protein